MPDTLSGKFEFKTSPDGELKIGDGFALFPSGANRRAIKLAYEKTVDLVNDSYESWWLDYEILVRCRFFGGFSGPGYALQTVVDMSSTQFTKIPGTTNQYSITQAQFKFSGRYGANRERDGLSAGIKIGVEFAFTFKFFVDFGPELDFEAGVSFDVLNFLLGLIIDRMAGDRANKGKVSYEGGLSLYDEGFGQLAGGSAAQVSPSLVLKISLAALIPPLKRLLDALDKWGGSVGVGFIFKVLFPVKVTPVSLTVDQNRFLLNDPKDESKVFTSNKREASTTVTPTLGLKHQVGISLALGVYAEISILNIFSAGLEFVYDLKALMGWATGPEIYNNLDGTTQAGLGVTSSGTALNVPEVIFDVDTSAHPIRPESL
ncbi:hypothetical protein F0U62_09805 [Cystobacter fuscus]|uniref:hypothetical protein n=1 Tax=Cystobacter fuscus TaxID=43 RepID=UPI002B2D0885|nr:hypothetical protein F0U62_09805 [Cystobacter fuscus]